MAYSNCGSYNIYNDNNDTVYSAATDLAGNLLETGDRYPYGICDSCDSRRLATTDGGEHSRDDYAAMRGSSQAIFSLLVVLMTSG